MKKKPGMSGMPPEMKNVLPLWIAASLGKQVVTLKNFDEGYGAFPAGSPGKLSGLMVADDGHVYALVVIDPKDPSALENFEFDEIAPAVSRVAMSLNIEEGLLAY